MTARLRILFVLAATLVVQLLVTSDAHAYAASGKPWPGGTITYWSTLPANCNWGVNAATRAWNVSGARIRFVRARTRRSAQMEIRVTIPPGVTGPGAASAFTSHLGYWRGHKEYVIITCDRSTTMLEQSDTFVRLLAHELGHVIGLGHSDPDLPACAIMKTYLNACQYARVPQIGYWYCRMLFRDDINGAIRLYGRKTVARTPSYCPVLPAPRRLTDVTAAGGENETAVTLHWTNPGLRSTDKIIIEAHNAACADVTEKTRVMYWWVKPTITAFTDDGDRGRAPGTWCFTIHAENATLLGGPVVKVERHLTLAPPVVGALTENPSEFVDYEVPVTYSSRASLEVRRAPSGACATTVDAGESVGVSYDYDTQTSLLSDIPAGSWCLSFFATAYGATSGGASSAVTREVMHVD